MRKRVAMLIALISLAPSVSAQPVPPPMAAAEEAVPALHYLTEAEGNPALLVPPPARPGSVELTRALDQVRATVAAASADRRVEAEADQVEVVTQFNAAAGRDLAKLPATAALLTAISDETEAVVARDKLLFQLPRPYQVDPTLPHCGKGGGAAKAYPSGHAGSGYSVGWTLARLLPERAPALLQRAQDYAFSREVCGVHFHADTEASRVIATYVAERLLADPRLAPMLAAARSELAAH